jgi:hypothetical protein
MTSVLGEPDSVYEKPIDDLSPEFFESLRPTVPPGRPAGCPVDPCRIFLFVASRRIRTMRTPTLPVIPEEQPTFTPTARERFWKKLFCCLIGDGAEEDERPVLKPAAPMRRTKSSSADLAALGAAASGMPAECQTLGLI